MVAILYGRPCNFENFMGQTSSQHYVLNHIACKYRMYDIQVQSISRFLKNKV